MDEEVELGAGELLDYNPIPRPDTYRSSASGMKYSDNSGDENESLDSESGNDSDSPAFRAKKPKLKKRCTTLPQPTRANKYNVWCSEVQESSLTEDLVNCGVRLDRTRSVESYDYKLAHIMEDESQERPQGVKRRYGERGNVKSRLGKRPAETDYRGSPRAIFDLFVTTENTNEEVASDIANKLCEEKDDLILRVVEVLGKEKAMDIFRKTRKIEEDGGMMVLNNSRRRTPGGVFLLLVKRDDDIQQEKLNLIFTKEEKKKLNMKKLSISQSRKAKAEELRRSLSVDGMLREGDLPSLLTRGELQLEARNKHRETDGEAAVTNPPPSPATDGRENSCDGVPEEFNGQLVSYDDGDFLLDNACDNMDVF